MDLGLKGKKAIVTGGSLGIGKAIARELAREGADVAVVSRTKDVLEAAAGEIAAETGRRVIAIPADVTSQRPGGRHGGPGGGAARRAPHPGQLRLAARRLAQRHRAHRGPRGRGPPPRLQREVRGRAPLRPRRHPLHEGAEVGPHHQHQRPQRAQCRQSLRRRPQHLAGAHQQDPRRAARPLRHHGELRAPRHHPHRADAAPARRAGQGAGRGRGRGGEDRLRPRLREGERDRPHGRRDRGRLRYRVPLLRQGLGDLGRADRGLRRAGRSVYY